MPRKASSTSTNQVIGQGLIAAETVMQELRDRLIRRLARERNRLGFRQLVSMARSILRDFEPLLAQVLADTEIAAWIIGADSVVKRLPQEVSDILAEGLPPTSGTNITTPSGSIPPAVPSVTVKPRGVEKPVIRFPLLEIAAEDLQTRNVVIRSEFDQLSEEMRRQAFTVAHQSSEETIGRIRDVLWRNVQQGPSLQTFREQLEAEIGASAIGPGHVENVFRTNVQSAFANGQESIAKNAVVMQVFPFARIAPIDDGRVRETHLSLATSGLNGGPVYWADDPMWDFFTPPIEWQ